MIGFCYREPRILKNITLKIHEFFDVPLISFKQSDCLRVSIYRFLQDQNLGLGTKYSCQEHDAYGQMEPQNTMFSIKHDKLISFGFSWYALLQ